MGLLLNTLLAMAAVSRMAGTERAVNEGAFGDAVGGAVAGGCWVAGGEGVTRAGMAAVPPMSELNSRERMEVGICCQVDRCPKMPQVSTLFRPCQMDNTHTCHKTRVTPALSKIPSC